MKSLFRLVFLFLFANSAFAGNLCDTSCSLTMAFPTGGSITAVEPLTFTFGDGGLVDTVATSTAYVAGNTLSLGTGETLTFGVDGSFDLGTGGGNLDYSNIAITTDGSINIQAVGGSETIYLYNITVSGAATLSLTAASISAEGEVIIGADATLNFSTSGSTSGCETTSSGVTLTSGTETQLIDTSDDCNTISTDTGVILGDTSTSISTGDVGELTLTSDSQTDSGSLNMFFVFLLTLLRVLRNAFAHAVMLDSVKQ